MKIFTSAFAAAAMLASAPSQAICDQITFVDRAPGVLTFAFARVWKNRHETVFSEYARVTGYAEQTLEDATVVVYIRQIDGAGSVICTKFLQMPLSVSDGARDAVNAGINQ